MLPGSSQAPWGSNRFGAMQRDVFRRVAVAGDGSARRDRRSPSGCRPSGAESGRARPAPSTRSSSSAPAPWRSSRGRPGHGARSERPRCRRRSVVALALARRAAKRSVALIHSRHSSSSVLQRSRQPMREAYVVGVHVGDEHAQHRQAVELRREHLLPGSDGRRVRDAAVDDGPALSAVEPVAQQPQVDVVERKRQLHAHPAHARRHLERNAGCGQGVAERVVEFGFPGIGHAHPGVRLLAYVNVNPV